MSCEYCEGKKDILNSRTILSLKGAGRPGIEIFIDVDELSVVAVSDTYEPSYQEEYVNIKFCPMCGERLTGVPGHPSESWSGLQAPNN